MRWEHLEFSTNFPPQCRHDSSDNSFHNKSIKIKYKKHVGVVHLKDQQTEDYIRKKKSIKYGQG